MKQRLANLMSGVVDDLLLPPSWQQSLEQDVVLGILAADTEQVLEPNWRLGQKVVTQTIFRSKQLFHDDEADARLAHTAKRISFLQENHVSNAVQELVWIVTNSTKRNSRMPITDTPVQRAIYRLTDRLIDALNPPVRWIQQRTDQL
ncbi:hypothetical protein OIV83_006062 [Microbotryomycetes sp. JL201]|nr:hypothetical protein OIV83_006062 [Microbotryomycetes sp. JL201]